MIMAAIIRIVAEINFSTMVIHACGHVRVLSL